MVADYDVPIYAITMANKEVSVKSDYSVITFILSSINEVREVKEMALKVIKDITSQIPDITDNITSLVDKGSSDRVGALKLSHEFVPGKTYIYDICASYASWRDDFRIHSHLVTKIESSGSGEKMYHTHNGYSNRIYSRSVFFMSIEEIKVKATELAKKKYPFMKIEHS